MRRLSVQPSLGHFEENVTAVGVFRPYANFAAPTTFLRDVWRIAMGNHLLGGIAIASALTFMVQSAPASTQAGCGVDHPCSGYSAAGAAPTLYRYQRHG